MTKKSNAIESSNQATDADIANLSFEEAMTNLEDMIERIESGEVGLEESLAEYQRGITLYRRCRDILNQAEQRFEKLKFDDDESVDDEADSD